MKFLAFYVHRLTSEKSCKTLYADDVNEATKQAERWVRKGYILLKVIQT